MKLFGNFNRPIRLRKNILKTIVRSQGQSIYDEMIHNVVSDVVCLFLTPNLRIDIRKGNGLATLFNTIHDLLFSYFE